MVLSNQSIAISRNYRIIGYPKYKGLNIIKNGDISHVTILV